MLETYKLKLFYPASKIHQALYPQGALEGCTGVNITINNNSQEGGGMCELKINSKESFRYQLARMIRSICMITQRLDPLPRKKFMTMQLTYYDGVTPKDYEPPGFRSTIFDVDLIFEKDPYMHDFGPARSTYHQVALQMSSVLASSFKEIEAPPPPAQSVPTKADSQVALLNTIDKPLVPVPVPTHEPLNHPQEVPRVPQSKDVATGGGDAENKNDNDIACLCGDQSNDTEMVQCEKCEMWQHTPCAGFCSNNDRRISKGYTCLTCLYGPFDQQASRYIRDLSLKRRTIGILFSEGIASGSNLRIRLRCSKHRVPSLIKDLEDEKILHVNRLSHTPKITKITSKETKDYIISRYFSEITPEKHPQLACLFEEKKPTTAVKGKSARKAGSSSQEGSISNDERSFVVPNKRPKVTQSKPQVDSKIPVVNSIRKSAVTEIAQDGCSSTLD